jgi:hypothetical protein|tara:strand:+ start:1645 stop:2475 length:831 start_codon:yes stop_codon:yes gene_type:complete
MATNPHFPNFAHAGEQQLINDLYIEAIKVYGIDVKYMPRTITDRDDIFGEDVLSTFDAAAGVEMYVKNVDGWEGEAEFLSRFGVEIRDEMIFVLAQDRWDQIKTEKILTEQNYNFKLEGTAGDLLKIETGTGDAYTITANRPEEGDLIYFTVDGARGALFQIDFVEHESVFYPTGTLPVYELRCSLFEYSSERISTGNTIIDAIKTSYSTDMLGYEILAETGDKILVEGGSSSIILETYDIDRIDPQANNMLFNSENIADSIIDFSEINPFGDREY